MDTLWSDKFTEMIIEIVVDDKECKEQAMIASKNLARVLNKESCDRFAQERMSALTNVLLKQQTVNKDAKAYKAAFDALNAITGDAELLDAVSDMLLCLNAIDVEKTAENLSNAFANFPTKEVRKNKGWKNNRGNYGHLIKK